MEGFNGYENQDFKYFFDMTPEYQRIIKNKMSDFGDMVYSMLPDNIRTSFKRNRAKNIKNELSHAMYSIGKSYKDRSKFQLCGLAIILDRLQLSFSAIIKGGSFMDDKPIGILYRKISQEPDRFINLLSSYGSDYFIKVCKRAPAKGDKIKLDSERWLPLLSINLSQTNFDMVEYVLAVLEQEKLPVIQLSSGLDAGHGLLGKPQELAEYAVRIMKSEYDFLMFAEG